MSRVWSLRLATLAGAMMLIVLLAACGDADTDADSADTPAQDAPPTLTPSPEAVTEVTATVDDAEDLEGHATADPEVVPPTMTPSAPPAAEPTADPGSEAAEEPDDPAPEPEDADEPLPEPENPAPELVSTGAWYNSEPLTLAELRGRPVLLVFWATY